MWKAVPPGDPKGTTQSLASGSTENQKGREESESDQASSATSVEETEDAD